MWKVPLLLLLLASALAKENEAKSSEESEEFRELEIDDLIKNLEVQLNAQKGSNGGKKIDEKEIYEMITAGPIAEEEAQGFPRCTRQKAYLDPRDRAAYKAYVAARLRPEMKIDYDPEIDELRKEANSLCKDPALSDNRLSDYERQQKCYRTLLRLKDFYSLQGDRPPLKNEKLYASKQSTDNSRELADQLVESVLELVRKRLDLNTCNCPQCTAEAADKATTLSIPIPTLVAPSGNSDDMPKRDVSSETVTDSPAQVADMTSEKAKKAAEAADEKDEILSSRYLGGQMMNTEEFERKMIMDAAIEQAATMIRELAMKTKSAHLWRSNPDFERQVLDTAIQMVNKVVSGITGDNQDQLDGFKYQDANDYLRSANADAEEVEVVPVSNEGFDYVHPAARTGEKSRGNCESCSKYDLRMSGMCPLCKRRSREEALAKVYHLKRTDEVPEKILSLGKMLRKE